MGNYLVIGWGVCLVKGRQHKECKSGHKELLHPCFPHCESSEQEWAPAEGERAFIAQLSAAGKTVKLSVHQPLLFTSVSLWPHLQNTKNGGLIQQRAEVWGGNDVEFLTKELLYTGHAELFYSILGLVWNFFFLNFLFNLIIVVLCWWYLAYAKKGKKKKKSSFLQIFISKLISRYATSFLSIG